jgi:hypothetical protein
MRRYDDPVDVRRGPVPGSGQDAPAQFLWRGRLWKVRAVVAHWVETAPWWQAARASAVVLGDAAPEPVPGGDDLLVEREVWRVEAGRGAVGEAVAGVFDLSFDGSADRWQLVGCVD